MPTKIVYQIFNSFNNKILYLFISLAFSASLFMEEKWVCLKKASIIMQKTSWNCTEIY